MKGGRPWNSAPRIWETAHSLSFFFSVLLLLWAVDCSCGCCCRLLFVVAVVGCCCCCCFCVPRVGHGNTRGFLLRLPPMQENQCPTPAGAEGDEQQPLPRHLQPCPAYVCPQRRRRSPSYLPQTHHPLPPSPVSLCFLRRHDHAPERGLKAIYRGWVPLYYRECIYVTGLTAGGPWLGRVIEGSFKKDGEELTKVWFSGTPPFSFFFFGGGGRGCCLRWLLAWCGFLFFFFFWGGGNPSKQGFVLEIALIESVTPTGQTNTHISSESRAPFAVHRDGRGERCGWYCERASRHAQHHCQERGKRDSFVAGTADSAWLGCDRMGRPENHRTPATRCAAFVTSS